MSARTPHRDAIRILFILNAGSVQWTDPSDATVWLKDTLEKLPTWPNSRIDELLPLRFAN